MAAELTRNPRLEPGGRMLARVELEQPRMMFAGDRFVVRDWAQRQTLAGGVVLDPDPPPGRRRRRRRCYRAEQHNLLEARAAASTDVSTFLRTLLERDGVIRRSGALTKSRFDDAACDAILRSLIDSGGAVPAGDYAVAAARWRDWRASAAAAVDAHHAAHPEHAGIPLAQLRRIRGIPEKLIDCLLDSLCSNGFVRRSACLARRTHRPALPPRLQGAGEAIRRRLAERPFDPPSRKELAADDAAFQALRFLIAGGEVVELSPDVVLAAEACAQAAARICTHLARQGSATVSQLKELLGSSRRVMVPLLERLDREGLTIRRGDLRVLRDGQV